MLRTPYTKKAEKLDNKPAFELTSRCVDFSDQTTHFRALSTDKKNGNKSSQIDVYVTGL